MANISVDWEVDGIISAEQSVAGMLRVVESKTVQDTGTFWTWQGAVSVRLQPCMESPLSRRSCSVTHGKKFTKAVMNGLNCTK